MRQTYFATFLLGRTGSAAPSLEEVLEPVRDWLGRTRAKVDAALSRSVDLTRTNDVSLGPQAEVRVLHVCESANRLFGLRLTHPDVQEDDVFWRSEICVAAANDATRFSMSNWVGRRSSRVSPLWRTPTRPRLVPMMLQRFGGREGKYDLSAAPRRLTNGSVDTFVQTLVDSERRLPVVLISTRVRDDRPVLEPQRVVAVADQVAGLAHVFAADNRFPSLKLSSRVGKLYGCWDGAVRVYWPGFRTGSNSLYHPLWFADKVAEDERRSEGFGSTLLAVLTRSAINRFVDAPVRWDDVEAHATRARIAELKAKGEDAGLLALYDEDNRRLSDRVKALEAQLLEANEALDGARRQEESWRLAYQESQRAAATGSTAAVIENMPPSSVKEAVERVMEEQPGKLELCLNSRSDYDRNEFEDVESVYAAVTWLATTYWLAKTGQVACKDLDLACREQSSFFYRAGQSSVTMGAYENYYKATYAGREVTLAEHIGSGSSKEPRYTIRIAFAFDHALSKVLIGYVGQHQKTDAT